VRATPVAAVAAVAFVGGLFAGARDDPAGQRAARDFVRAWERRDYARMYAAVDARTQGRHPIVAFATAHREALALATATELRFGEVPRPDDGTVTVPVRITSRVFGTIATELRLPVTEGDDARIVWDEHLVFPGLAPGERLTRRTELATRASLLARDNSVLAGGERRAPASPSAAAVVGELGAIPAKEAPSWRAAGYPPDARVGTSGLERVFERRLAGTPGGELLAGGRVLARSTPKPGRSVRTTISTRVQEAAVVALGGRLGGIAALRPRTGEILGLAGIAFSGLQPPGSTFKIVTLTAALEAGTASPRSRFPVQTSATLSGVTLQNANGESCGGTLTQSFAHSCNSVFAPLGAELGPAKLVAAAERFGFNEAPGIPGAATATIPAADRIGDDLAVGSTAIGQGRVQATALTMATLAATIAARGRRPRPTLLFGERRPSVRVTTPRIARTVEGMMLSVVRAGTGTAAAVPGVKVAGKTGTAELKSTAVTCPPQETDETGCVEPLENDPTDTDAWFAAYAPAGRPRIAVGVLLVRAGAGGDTAAPAARLVISAGLGR
jgi:cell division protein FtsI/penicillin-binding protein 2